MFVSFIIPAYNEEAVLGDTLERLTLSAVDCLGRDGFEIIVVDDASTDRTAEIARRRGARVIGVHKRHIAAVRNAGAKEARGDVFIFVDADTLLPELALQSTLIELQRGAVGGGSRVELEGKLDFFGWIFIKLFLIVWRALRLAAGCFIFVRRADFEAVGGFDERYFASEEIWLSKALKQRGRFVIIPEYVISSGRKARMHHTFKLFALSIHLLIKGPRAWQKREGLDLWYGGQRETKGA